MRPDWVKWFFIAVVSTMSLSAEANDCKPDKLPQASINHSWSKLFAGQAGPGWIGGDSTYSARLPDGRLAFVFSDTLIGTADQNGKSTLTGMPRNSMLVGSLEKLVPAYSGNYQAPKSLIPEPAKDKWFWAFATYVENGRQLVFVNEFDASNMFGHFTGTNAIAVMNVPEGELPQFSHLVPLPKDAKTAWGRAIVPDGNFVFVYGTNHDAASGAFHGMKIARIPKGKMVSVEAWQYWDGADWVSNSQNAIVVKTFNELDGVMKQPVRMGNGYMAVSIPFGVFDDTVLQLSFACNPQGPWSKPETIHTLPEITGPNAYKNEIAYLPTMHPELGDERSIIVSYNINTTDGFAAYKKNIHIYQPRFLTLKY